MFHIRKSNIGYTTGLLAALVFFLPGGASAGGRALAEQTSHYVETWSFGAIDWHDGILTASGEGRPPASATNPTQGRELARRAATVTALRNLLRVAQNIRIDADRTVADLESAPVIQDSQTIQVSGFLKNFQILDTVYHADESVTVKVGISMRGPFSEKILAYIIPSEAPVASSARDVGIQVILDARGSQIQPAMLLNIRSDQGDIIIGPLIAGRDYIIQRVSIDMSNGLRLQVTQIPTLILPGASAASVTDITLPALHAERLREVTALSRLHLPVIVLLD